MRQVIATTRKTRSWPTWMRYAATAALALCTLLLVLLLHPTLNPDPYLLFFAIVLLSASIFDHGSGFFAVVLSLVLIVLFVPPQVGPSDYADPRRIFNLLTFVSLGAFTTVVIEALHRAVHDLLDANQQLKRADEEKDLLMREAGHRTRNDL